MNVSIRNLASLIVVVFVLWSLVFLTADDTSQISLKNLFEGQSASVYPLGNMGGPPYEHTVERSEIWPGHEAAFSQGWPDHGLNKTRKWRPNHAYAPSKTWPIEDWPDFPKEGYSPWPPGHWERYSKTWPKGHKTSRSEGWPANHDGHISKTWPVNHDKDHSQGWPPGHWGRDSRTWTENNHEIARSRTWPRGHVYANSRMWRDGHRISISSDWHREAWPNSHQLQRSLTWPANHTFVVSVTWPSEHTLERSPNWPPNHATTTSEGESPQSRGMSPSPSVSMQNWVKGHQIDYSLYGVPTPFYRKIFIKAPYSSPSGSSIFSPTKSSGSTGSAESSGTSESSSASSAVAE